MSEELEEWRPIEGWGNRYMVSSHGRVAKILQCRTTTNGYRYACLSLQRVQKLFLIHQLVMWAFVGFVKGMWIHHKDNNKTHNHIGNLEYVTPRENTIRAFDDGLNFRGENKVEAKLTNEEARQIRDLCGAQVMSQREIGEHYGVSAGVISDIHIRKTWKTI